MLTVGFIKDAHEFGHPRRAFARVPQLMRESLEEVFLGDPFDIKSKRAGFLKKWMKRAVQLGVEEQQLHASLPSHLRTLLKDKKLQLWKEILLDLRYPDWKIVDEICQGFPLTWWAQASGVFQTRVKPPDFSLEQLEGMAKGLNMAVVASLESSDWVPLGMKRCKRWQTDGWQRNLILTSESSSLPRGSPFSRRRKLA